ncbi:MAG: hypothetical protein HY865_09460 [Chloroflexi bacterium]|nr:hypothetical protein [Chloroflexota bacterium]
MTHFIVLENKKGKNLINLDQIASASRIAMVNTTSGQVIEGKFCTKVFTQDGRENVFYGKAGDMLWSLLCDMSLVIDLDADDESRPVSTSQDDS